MLEVLVAEDVIDRAQEFLHLSESLVDPIHERIHALLIFSDEIVAIGNPAVFSSGRKDIDELFAHDPCRTYGNPGTARNLHIPLDVHGDSDPATIIGHLPHSPHRHPGEAHHGLRLDAHYLAETDIKSITFAAPNAHP